VDVATSILQATMEGMTKNLALEDAEVGDVGLRAYNTAAMRGGASVAKSVKKEGLHVGLMSLELKN
jgi:hypothetical protein